MPILGCGSCPAGSTPAGIGQFPTLNSSSRRLFWKDDGSQGSTAYTDPATQDRVLDERGIPKGNDSTPEKVRLALFTLRDSSVLKNFGLNLGAQTISATAAKEVEAKVKECLIRLTSAGLISIQGVDFNRTSPQQVRVQVRWVDLTNGRQFIDFIGP